MKKTVCICGGGNMGHVVAGFLAGHGDCEVSLLTRHPEHWQQQLEIMTPEGEILQGPLKVISSDPNKVVSSADIVLLCLPGYAIRDTLLQIVNFLRPDTAVGSVVSSTVFFFQALELLPKEHILFGFQRVPFISRVTEYGHCARLLGYKDCLNLAVEHAKHPEQLLDVLGNMLKTPIHLLDNYYEASLSNSNPLLHPSRLYSLWKDWKEGDTFTHEPLFYEEWTDEASQIYINMDNELQTLLEYLPVHKGSIPTVFEYYESSDVASLTNKLRNIEAFRGIKTPMKEVEGGYVPDFQSRYFTEDFPYGLAFVHKLAQENKVKDTTIERVLNWGMNMLKHTQNNLK
jgi:hypothetical protein